MPKFAMHYFYSETSLELKNEPKKTKKQNRYRAPLEHATNPEAWELVQSGSLHHWEGEATGGIWGRL
jgi:hypothetical protein